MVHVASADAVVGCFDAKYNFLLWRPVHAIQRADTDDNPLTLPDLTWNAPLNVNHPEYPSAHSCWSALPVLDRGRRSNWSRGREACDAALLPAGQTMTGRSRSVKAAASPLASFGADRRLYELCKNCT